MFDVFHNSNRRQIDVKGFSGARSRSIHPTNPKAPASECHVSPGIGIFAMALWGDRAKATFLAAYNSKRHEVRGGTQGIVVRRTVT